MSEKESVHLEIDSREDEDVIVKIIQHAIEHPDVETFEEKELPAADLAIGPIGFERKATGDYISSLTKQRLKEQVVKMEQHYEHAYVLYEGDLRETEHPEYSGISPASLRGSMASITARKDVPVLCCSNLSLLIDMAVRLARKHMEEESGYLPRGAVTGSDEPTAKKMYGCIPGVGPEMAEILYDEYPSVAQFLSNADSDELQKLDGVGPKTAETIMEGFL